jgi:hypothetical protein
MTTPPPCPSGTARWIVARKTNDRVQFLEMVLPDGWSGWTWRRVRAEAFTQIDAIGYAGAHGGWIEPAQLPDPTFD